MMYNQLSSRCNNSIILCSIRQAQVRLHLSQTILSFKSTPTRAFHLARNLRVFTAPRIQLTGLRSGIFKKNGDLLSGEHSRRLASTIRSKTDSLDINTEVLNNVYLYKYERPTFYKVLSISAVLQSIVWSFVAYLSYTMLPKRKPDEPLLSEYMYNNWLYICFVGLALITGVGGAIMVSLFVSRSIKYIVLNKGGKSVTVVTHGLFGKQRIVAPLEMITCVRARREMKSYMPIKIKGRSLFYLLDSAGEFINPTLFDYTVGLQTSKL